MKISPLLRQGVPLVLFVVAGSYGLSQFMGGALSSKDARVTSKSERAAQLEQTHAVLMRKMSAEMEDVQLKPIHRPPP